MNWIVDDAGTLINISTRNHYDYMEEIVDELNKLSEQNKQLKKENKELRCTIESNSQDDYIDYLKKQNEELKEIFIEQLESALTLSFIREEYCNALLRILDENDSVEESKKFIKDYLIGDSE